MGSLSDREDIAERQPPVAAPDADTAVMTRAGMILFRIVKSNPPTLRDFFSHEALGLVPRYPRSRRLQDSWRGVSMFSRATAALAQARAAPGLGELIAELHVPDAADIRVEQTGRNALHYTVWAEPLVLLRCVTNIVSFEAIG
jgi:hypothetical protein